MSYDFSIIIPFWKRVFELKLVLKGIECQDVSKDLFEVIIVDDGTEESIDDIINRYKKVMNLNYVRLDHTGNRARNRNTGVDHSRGKRIIFLDGDIIPERNLIRKFDEYTRDHPKRIALGYRYRLLDYDKAFLDEDVVGDDFDVIRNLLAFYDERYAPMKYSQKYAINIEGKWQLCYSNCMCFWKEEFEKIGGFDPVFDKHWGAEDIELGYRFIQNGCEIKICEDVHGYHLYHTRNWKKLLASLLKNYDILVKKHKHWLVELFIREYASWTIEMMKLIKKVKENNFVVRELYHLPDLLKILPPDVLLMGIDNETLISSEKVRSVLLPLKPKDNPKIENLFGIQTDFPDKDFDMVLLSEKYSDLNLGLFTMLKNEARRIGKEVLIINEDTSFNQETIHGNFLKNIPSTKFCLFTISNDFHLSFNKYYFSHLAMACDRIGMEVGLQLEFDPFQERDLTAGFLKFDDPAKQQGMEKILDHDLNFIGDFIPSIMNAITVKYCGRSMNTKILWDCLSYTNQDKERKKEVIPSIKQMFLQRKSEEKYFSSFTPRYIVPVGIDAKKMEEIAREKRDADTPFVFLWSDLFINDYSNLDMILEVFTELYADNSNVEMRILDPGNYVPPFDNPMFTRVVNAFLNNYYLSMRLVYNHYSDAIKAKYKHIKNIQFIQGVLSEDAVYREIHRCDAFINLSGRLSLAPTVLAARGLGKKSILLDNGTYDDYCDEGESFNVACVSESGCFPEPALESHILMESMNTRYFLVQRPVKESLKKIMKESVTSPGDLILPGKAVSAFREQYDWSTIAKTVMDILY